MKKHYNVGIKHPNWKGGISKLGHYSKNKHCKCGKLITDYMKRCKSCAVKRAYKLGLLDNKGANHPMYGKIGNMKGKYHTKQTKLKIAKANKGIRNGNYINGKCIKYNKCKICNKQLHNFKAKICRKCSNKGNSQVRHHIDLNNKNNNSLNILKLTRRRHTQLHNKSYEYLVKRNLVKDYINYFVANYGVK
jgi:ribosomal protein L30/L7E